MAQRRMFSISVIDTDLFNDLPISARLLYYELGMRADDDGFLSSPKKIIRMIGCTEDDLKILVAKGFVIGFNTGVIVITHWKMHNYIQKDRYNPTIYIEEKSRLTLLNQTYSLSDEASMDTHCIHSVSVTDTQERIGKDRLVKDRLNNMSTDVDKRTTLDYESIIKSFNTICKSLPQVQKLTDNRRKAIKTAKNHLNNTTFEELFKIVELSDFLTGRSGTWNGCCFDWLLKPSNLTKIIERNYNNRHNQSYAVKQYTGYHTKNVY